jgi:hypothetical protein
MVIDVHTCVSKNSSPSLAKYKVKRATIAEISNNPSEGMTFLNGSKKGSQTLLRKNHRGDPLNAGIQDRSM